MSQAFYEIAMTPSVRAAQAAMGADGLWGDRGGARRDAFTDAELGFIARRDSFYMSTVSQTGWPYVQHRGGPAGFLKALDDRTLAFADYRGNRQYISVGNLAANDRAALILMDYANKARLKIYARVETRAPQDDPALAARVATPGYRGLPERIVLLHLEAFDWNCPQHIVRRFTEAEIAEAVAPLRDRLSALEAENAALQARLAEAGSPASAPSR